MNKAKIGLILGSVCLILTCAIVMQIRTINQNITVSDLGVVSDELRDEVLKWKEKYDNSYKELEKAEKELEEERAEATKNDEASKTKEEELKKGNAVLGLTDVTGEGIIITLKDNPTVTTETIGALDDISKYIIHQEDLLNLMNELKNAGAEAISINDQRIIPSTAIICSGNITQVNGEKVGAPFIIKAIGKPDELKEALERPGGIIDLLNSYGIVTDIKTSNNLTVLKYDGVIQHKYMKEIK